MGRSPGSDKRHRARFSKPVRRPSFEPSPGQSLMEAARDYGLPGIRADCGGACSCSTCHVYVDPQWADRLPPVQPLEEDMLEFAWQPVEGRSRLACQIPVTPDLDGLELHVPAEQA